MIIRFVILFFIISNVQSGNITLIPEHGYLGKIPQVEVCDFSFGPGTILSPITRLTIDPYSESYGNDSVIVGGMNCYPCWVPRIEMNEFGITTIYCELK